MVMMDWLGKMLELPEEFLFSGPGRGGGVIQVCTFWIIQRMGKVESFQDFLFKVDMKPCVHLLEICIYSLNNVIVRPTKIMNRADKNWARFLKTMYFKNQSFQKNLFHFQVDLFTEKKIRKIRLIFNAEKWLWKYTFCKLWGGCL